ncbi:hypothetical protein KAW96_10135 [candidate division WOR-3 bacterium]|nr:hypothetical protein [candidate division WOR-3 bacterium]
MSISNANINEHYSVLKKELSKKIEFDNQLMEKEIISIIEDMRTRTGYNFQDKILLKFINLYSKYNKKGGDTEKLVSYQK